MKKLKKILLINWLYFSKQLIEVDDINFLTGKNGAGKSTVIDALQIVLLGETNSRNFNQAANEKSQRTLEGYLRADMDENSPYSRRGKDFSSYIACEFFDETEGTYFVTGVVFDCRNDGTCREHFFIYDGELPENCFIENQTAMDITKLRNYFKQNYGVHAKLYDTQKQYRTDMLAKWNVHNEQVTRMLKKAVSFRPIVDIQKFITENICDIPNKPDIEAMQQNIRDYKRHEELAQRQEEKLAVLQKIADLYREWQAAINRWQEHRFLVDWAKKENLRSEIDKHELEKEECAEGVKNATDSIDQASILMAQKEQRKNELITALGQSDIYREHDNLSERKKHLEDEQKKLLSHIQNIALEMKREAVSLCRLCESEKLNEWQTRDTLIPVTKAADTLQTAFSTFLNCDYTVFSNSIAVFENAQTASASFANAVRDVSHTVENMFADLQRERDQKQAVLSNLHKNIKDYPKGLLQFKERLSAELLKLTSQHIQIDILADVLEIRETDEQWRNAVEGYLNRQKFYLLIDPPYYKQAVSVYNQIKNEYDRHSFGLVDIEKIREKEKVMPERNSLATKIETQNPLARTYIDYLLGRVICCSHANELRNHKIAITANGMLYQGYVMRSIPKERMEDAFIGRRAVALRISKLLAELEIIENDIRIWSPINAQLNKQKNKEYLFSQFFVQNTVTQCQNEYLRGLEISREVAEIEKQISGLDLTWLMQIKEKIDELEKEIKCLDNKKTQYVGEKAQAEQMIHMLEYDILPDLWQKFNDIEYQIGEEYTQKFTNEVGIPRYQQELKRLRKASIVEKNFGGHLSQTISERDDAQKKLFSKRLDYVRNFQPCSFHYDTADNDEFAEEKRILEESELPKYRKKIQAARESAMEQFQNDFLAKLKSSIDQVKVQVKNLNKALKQAQFGTDQYQFRVDRNPDYAEYYDMIMDPELMEDNAGLFALPFQQKYGELIEELFNRLATSDDTHLNARKESELKQNIELYTDFRTYLKFDLETTDQNGSKQLLSQTLNTKSGGETQTPFYIAVLASFAQLYQVNDISGVANNTVRLVVFDEAFNKMDSERIIESVRLLRKMHLQAIICTPPDKLPDIMPLADRTLLVEKDKYQMHVLSWGKESLHE